MKVGGRTICSMANGPTGTRGLSLPGFCAFIRCRTQRCESVEPDDMRRRSSVAQVPGGLYRERDYG